MSSPLLPLQPSPNPFLSSTIHTLHPNLYLRHKKPTPSLPKASSDQNPEPKTDPKHPDTDSFDSRLDQVRLRYRSGIGKKAEIRKGKIGKKVSTPGSSIGTGGVFLPPVPLKDPVSGSLKVEFGFSPYSEQVNGRLAGLGLAALLLVELATGKSVIKYHQAEIVFVQLYFMAAVCAVYLKYEKEKVSVWPLGDAPSVASNDQ